MQWSQCTSQHYCPVQEQIDTEESTSQEAWLHFCDIYKDRHQPHLQQLCRTLMLCLQCRIITIMSLLSKIDRAMRLWKHVWWAMSQRGTTLPTILKYNCDSLLAWKCLPYLCKSCWPASYCYHDWMSCLPMTNHDFPFWHAALENNHSQWCVGWLLFHP